MQKLNYLSLTVQGIYVLITGLQLIFIPATLLGMFGFDPPVEIWIKVLLVVSGQTKSSLLLFAGVDVATAVWTWFELKKKS